MLSGQCYLVSGEGRRYWSFGDPNDALFLQTAPFLPAVIQHGVGLNFRFTLVLVDIEELFARRNDDVRLATCNTDCKR